MARGNNKCVDFKHKNPLKPWIKGTDWNQKETSKQTWLNGHYGSWGLIICTPSRRMWFRGFLMKYQMFISDGRASLYKIIPWHILIFDNDCPISGGYLCPRLINQWPNKWLISLSRSESVLQVTHLKYKADARMVKSSPLIHKIFCLQCLCVVLLWF